MMVKVTLLCTDKNHPVFPYLQRWREENQNKFEIQILNSVKEVNDGGDILFLVSCSEIVREETRSLFKHVLVLHASDLPTGRGWSPHIWDIVNGKNKIVLSLLEAKEPVDTGDIWKKLPIPLTGNELYDEINELLFKAELELIDWACQNVNDVKPQKQPFVDDNYLRKRTPEDSEIDISKSLDSQFNLLRVCDPNRFPAFFYKDGQKYTIRIEKHEN